MATSVKRTPQCRYEGLILNRRKHNFFQVIMHIIAKGLHILYSVFDNR